MNVLTREPPAPTRWHTQVTISIIRLHLIKTEYSIWKDNLIHLFHFCREDALIRIQTSKCIFREQWQNEIMLWFLTHWTSQLHTDLKMIKSIDSSLSLSQTLQLNRDLYTLFQAEALHTPLRIQIIKCHKMLMLPDRKPSRWQIFPLWAQWAAGLSRLIPD